MGQVLTQIKLIWGRLSALQKGLVAGTGAVVVLGILAAVLLGGATDWRVLATDLGRKEAQDVLARLDDTGIPWKLRDGGATVEVPADRWDEVQAVVVRNNLLSPESGRGFETAFGTDLTSTKEQQAFRRLVAQQEELEMAIARQEGIAGATVYLTPAKRHWTKEGTERAKASVMIRPEPGHLVTAPQVESIVRFVAGAVKELDPDNVVVTDTRGMLLARPDSAETPVGVAAGVAQAHGMRLQGAAQDALERVFGPERAVVRCHVDLDMEQVRTETDGFIPDSKVVMSEKIRSTENARPQEEGTVSTSAVQAGSPGGGLTGSRTEDIDTTYDHGRRKEVRIKDQGEVAHLAVSVLADESLSGHAEAIESIVKSAVGYQEKRGDAWGGVRFAPFAETAEPEAPPEPSFWESGLLWKIVRWSVTGLVGVGMVVILLLSAARARRGVRKSLARIAEEKSSSKLEVRKDPKDELRDLVGSDVETVSKLLRNWLYEPAGGR